MPKQFNIRFIALFLLSAAVIGYELAVMRNFSVGSWSNFGSMVISIALLGFGLAGVILTFIQNKILIEMKCIRKSSVIFFIV